jgi:exosortase O
MTSSRKPALFLLANALILLLWAWLYHPVYPYLATIFTRQEFRANQIVLLIALALVVVQVRRGGFRPRPASPPQLYTPALLLCLGASLGFLLAERFLDINTLSATLFGLATYGLLGLWLRPAYWRRGLPAALILIGALPFGEHMDTFIGYPVRLATARLVSAGLEHFGVPNLGVDTILIFENGVSQVDNPCSGVKSLWTGALFFLAATWIDARPLNRRWLLAGIAFALLLLAANLGRVALLVLVGQVVNLRLLAQMLHVPLGVIGFVAACAAGWAMLRWAGVLPAIDEPQGSPQPASRPAWLVPALLGTLLVMALLYAPRPQASAAAAASSAWSFPASLDAQPWSLSPSELEWLYGSEPPLSVSASRWRFQWQGMRGSMLFILSDTWRAHHRPERCFTVYGLEVQGSQPFLPAPGFPLRWLSLGPHAGPTLYSAAYWLQSTDRLTEDYAARIWDDLAPRPQPWVLVTVIFDAPLDPNDPRLPDLFNALRLSVQAGLEEGW